MDTPASTSDSIENISQNLGRLMQITNDVVVNLNTTVNEISSTANDLSINIDSILAKANKSIDEAMTVFHSLNITFYSIQKSSHKFDHTIGMVDDIIISVKDLNILDKFTITVESINTSIIIVNWTLILATSFISIILLLNFIEFIFKIREKNKYVEG